MTILQTLHTLRQDGLVHPPDFLLNNTHYLTMMGSVAYGVSTDFSDQDIYGFCIPPKAYVFPHILGVIPGFGRQPARFEQWQEHHVKYGGASYDFSVYSIVKFFQLAMENHPNMVDALFVPANCIVHITNIGRAVRENRHLFLHKGCWHKFKGYAYSQMNMMSRNFEGGRKELVEKFGYDVKSAYHVVRLLNEVEQILTTGDLDLQRNKAQLIAIREGRWSEQDVRNHFAAKEKELEQAYANSSLPYGPQEGALRALLVECLEVHFGSLREVIGNPSKEAMALLKIKEIIRNLDE